MTPNMTETFSPMLPDKSVQMQTVINNTNQQNFDNPELLERK